MYKKTKIICLIALSFLILLVGCSGDGLSDDSGLSNDIRYGLGEHYNGRAYSIRNISHPKENIWCVITQEEFGVIPQIVIEQGNTLTIGRASEKDFEDNGCTNYMNPGNSHIYPDSEKVAPQEELKAPTRIITPFVIRR